MKICFESDPHQPLELPDESNLSEHLNVQNSPVLFGCRTGICGTCLSEVAPEDGASLAPPSADESELLEIIAPENDKARLVCQVRACGAIRLRYIGQ